MIKQSTQFFFSRLWFSNNQCLYFDVHSSLLRVVSNCCNGIGNVPLDIRDCKCRIPIKSQIQIPLTLVWRLTDTTDAPTLAANFYINIQMEFAGQPCECKIDDIIPITINLYHGKDDYINITH